MLHYNDLESGADFAEINEKLPLYNHPLILHKSQRLRRRYAPTVSISISACIKSNILKKHLRSK